MWSRRTRLFHAPQHPVVDDARRQCLAATAGMAAVAARMAERKPTADDWNSLFQHLRHAYRAAQCTLLSVPLDAYAARFGERAVRDRSFVNIGAGRGWTHPAWRAVALDTARPSSDDYLVINLRGAPRLPMADDSVKLVYSSHCLEHLDDASGAAVLAEAFRVLEPGGLIRLVLPDAALALKAWRNGDREFWEALDAEFHHGASPTQCFLSFFAHPCSMLCPTTPHHYLADHEVEDLFARLPADQAMDACVARYPADLWLPAGPHLTWYDAPKLRRALADAGFVAITDSAFGQSEEPVLRDLLHFDFTSPELSCHVEARKPVSTTVMPKP